MPWYLSSPSIPAAWEKGHQQGGHFQPPSPALTHRVPSARHPQEGGAQGCLWPPRDPVLSWPCPPHEGWTLRLHPCAKPPPPSQLQPSCLLALLSFRSSWYEHPELKALKHQPHKHEDESPAPTSEQALSSQLQVLWLLSLFSYCQRSSSSSSLALDTSMWLLPGLCPQTPGPPPAPATLSV